MLVKENSKQHMVISGVTTSRMMKKLMNIKRSY